MAENGLPWAVRQKMNWRWLWLVVMWEKCPRGKNDVCSGENQVKALIFHLRKNGPTAQPIRQSADIITAVLTVFSSLSATRHIAWRWRELETISCFKKKPLAKRRAAAAPPSAPPWQPYYRIWRAVIQCLQLWSSRQQTPAVCITNSTLQISMY